MSKFEEKLELYNSSLKQMKLNCDTELLSCVAKGLGPSIYNKDAETIACTSDAELKTVRESFLKKKLKLDKDDDTLNEAIQEVCEKMGRSNRQKYRAIFYCFLTIKFDKQSVYI
ncbi:MAG: DUF2853 domain-containing protein [Epsilonproteobacteria bacterium]|nr:MAG: DUF2853 domain-containing protein [Campylobacterota bacterium]